MTKAERAQLGSRRSFVANELRKLTVRWDLHEDVSHVKYRKQSGVLLRG